MSKLTCGMNGFGRFGLHLLNYYLDPKNESLFDLKYINDDLLNINQALDIIVHDKYVKIYDNFKVTIDNDYLVFNDSIRIKYTNELSRELSWLGSPDIFLECTGQHTDAEISRKFKTGKTKKVLISATSLNADKTLVYGFNHKEYEFDDDVISYGSCTVNAFVPLASSLNEIFGVLSSDVNVIHNIPEYQLKNGSIQTPGQPPSSLKRKGCTLSKVAPNLLDFVSNNNFNVNYTLIPYTGVSIIDYRFELTLTQENNSFDHIWEEVLKKECKEGSLSELFDMQDDDDGPEKYQNSKFSSILIKEHSFLRNNNLYLYAYFDNENSVNRYFDLVNYVCNKLSA